MTDAAVAAYLITLHGLSVIIGNINVHFQNALLQDSVAGPPRRLDLFTHWLSKTGQA
jgi:hypothetical protein